MRLSNDIDKLNPRYRENTFNSGRFDVELVVEYIEEGNLQANSDNSQDSATTTTQQNPAPTFNPHHTYTDQQSDPESGLMYYNARYYDTDLKRFTSFDYWNWGEKLNSQTQNHYSYVVNNPLRYVDPSGKQAAMVGEGYGFPIDQAIVLGEISLVIARLEMALAAKFGESFVDKKPKNTTTPINTAHRKTPIYNPSPIINEPVHVKPKPHVYSPAPTTELGFSSTNTGCGVTGCGVLAPEPVSLNDFVFGGKNEYDFVSERWTNNIIIKEGLRGPEATKAANELGYDKVRGVRSHGQPVFRNEEKNGNPNFITPDADVHSGGEWKGGRTPRNLGSKTTRDGTYDGNLNWIGE